MNDYFSVGKIVNTHGIKGEVKVIPLTEEVSNFKRYKKVLIDDNWMDIQSVKFQKDRVILKLDGIDDMNQAENYKNKYVKILRSTEPELDDDMYYIVDIIGSQLEDTSGKKLGVIYDVIQTKNNDVYWIKEPKELLIPVLEEIVTSIDEKNKKVIIKPVGIWQDED